MRIAISGTHCSGKSSLVAAFVEEHPHYSPELEAYEALEQLHGELFSGEANAEDLCRQLEYCVARIQHYNDDECVVFERSPLDYVGYLQALSRLKRETANSSLTERAIDMAKTVITHLDLIAYLPLHGCELDVSDEEDLKLRDAVDRRLEAILLDDELDILNAPRPTVVELTGSTHQRLLALNKLLGFRGET